MVAGELPFFEEDTNLLSTKILFGDYEVPKHFSKSLKQLISRMLETNANKRLTI